MPYCAAAGPAAARPKRTASAAAALTRCFIVAPPGLDDSASLAPGADQSNSEQPSGRPALVSVQPRVAVAVVGLAAVGRLRRASALEVQAGVVGVGHADAAVHL